MATTAVTLLTALCLATPPNLAVTQETPPIPPKTTTTASADLPTPAACQDPAMAKDGCSLAADLYHSRNKWKKRAQDTYIDLQKTQKQLKDAEDALAKKTEAPEPRGLDIPTGWVIGGVTVSFGLGALAGFLLTR